MKKVGIESESNTAVLVGNVARPEINSSVTNCYGFEEKLDEIIGLNVSGYIPDVIVLPLACITLRPDNPVEYDYTSQNQSWVYHFQIQVIVNKGGSVLVAQEEFDAYMEWFIEKQY